MTETHHPASNRLANETSPYLLQHAANPVDWYPWGPEALERAKREDRPILLSIGYSACHWCHVMAHESFEDPDTAGVMNRHFINIKVDREERPDLDEIYMTATQILTHHGGWPMTVFLTPDLQPFYCGTYFPPEPNYGMPGFRQVLEHVARLWREGREQAIQTASQLSEGMRRYATLPASDSPKLDHQIADAGAQALERSHDPEYGGFGGAPKFPQPMAHLFLLRHWKRTGRSGDLDVVAQSCRRMARGGICDHLGGGFARYSVDERWLVPHFEKMLYDNALLARLYLETHQATGDPEFLDVASGILDYVLRDMTSPAGGFYSSEDADSEGVEGKFYVWTPQEVREAIGDDAAAKIVLRWFGVSDEGNFEHGTTILTRGLTPAQCARLVGATEEQVTSAVAIGARRLFDARARRVRPGRDDKVLAGWTGLMAGAFALGHRVTGSALYGRAAANALEFVLGPMSPQGRLCRTWKAGAARIDAFQEDYAFVLEAMLALYEATLEPVWIGRAIELADCMIERFWDDSEGGFYFTEAGREDLLVRTKSPYENAIPSGNSAAVAALLRLARLTGRTDFADRAKATLAAFQLGMERSPSGFPYLLAALEFALAPPRELVLAAPDAASLAPFVSALGARYEPHLVLAAKTGAPGEDRIATLAGKSPVRGAALAYLCRDFTCLAPATNPAALKDLLDEREIRAL